MPDINTIFFRSDLNDSICRLNNTESPRYEICSPSEQILPYSYLQGNENLLGNLLFTIIFLILFALIRLRGKDLFNNLLNVLIKRKKAEIIQNEGITSNLFSYILSLVLSFSILTICITSFASMPFFSWTSLYISGGLLLYHFSLLMLIHLLGWSFNAKALANEFTVNVWTYHILIGLLISPFVIAIFFVKSFAVLPLLNIASFCLIIFIIIKIIRWIEILFLHRVSILYMILYLCAFEFMPLLILYKMVVY